MTLSSVLWLSDFTFAFHFHALEKKMATHFSVLAWRIPGTGEPGGLPSLGSHRVGHDWSDLAAAEWYNQHFWLLIYGAVILKAANWNYWCGSWYFTTLLNHTVGCKLELDDPGCIPKCLQTHLCGRPVLSKQKLHNKLYIWIGSWK